MQSCVTYCVVGVSCYVATMTCSVAASSTLLTSFLGEAALPVDLIWATHLSKVRCPELSAKSWLVMVWDRKAKSWTPDRSLKVGKVYPYHINQCRPNYGVGRVFLFELSYAFSNTAKLQHHQPQIKEKTHPLRHLRVPPRRQHSNQGDLPEWPQQQGLEQLEEKVSNWH